MKILHISGGRSVHTERRGPSGKSQHPNAELDIAEDVYLDDILIGTVIYVRRRHLPKGSTYGWRRAEASSSSAVLTKAEAISQLIQEAEGVAS